MAGGNNQFPLQVQGRNQNSRGLPSTCSHPAWLTSGDCHTRPTRGTVVPMMKLWLRAEQDTKVTEMVDNGTTCELSTWPITQGLSGLRNTNLTVLAGMICKGDYVLCQNEGVFSTPRTRPLFRKELALFLILIWAYITFLQSHKDKTKSEQWHP